MAKAMQSLTPLAHCHLSSKNVMVDPESLAVKISDFGLQQLKRYCRIFHSYRMFNQWSSPEICAGDLNKESYDSSVDVYSFGMILWELETHSIPFDGVALKELKSILIDQKLRPKIPEDTDQKLSLLIRRCWQDTATKRPDLEKILSSLAAVKFK